MKVLVTGAQGLLGHELCEQLSAQGHHVVAVDDGSRGRAQPRCDQFISQNLATSLDLDTDFEVIYHFAARNGTPAFYANSNALIHNNVGADLAVMSHARRCARLKSFVYASSSEVVSGHAAPQAELTDICVENIHNPRWSYRLAKMISENYLVNSDLPWVILRYFNVYGANSMSGHFVHDILEKINQGKFELLGGDEVRCYCHVTDAVQATIDLHQCQGEIINIGSDQALTSREAADIILQVLGSPDQGWQDRPGRVGSSRRRIPDLSRLRQHLPDYQPRDFATGMRQVIDARCRRPSQ